MPNFNFIDGNKNNQSASVYNSKEPTLGNNYNAQLSAQGGRSNG
jgi:hypothetical protein